MKVADGSKKLTAIKLRKQSLSYSEISNKLNIPKSTLSDWLRDLPLSRTVKAKNIEKAKLVAARNIISFNKKRAIEYKKRVEEELSDYSKSLPSVKGGSLFWLGLGLFLAEGGRRKRWTVKFVNSNPIIVKAIMKFFREVCGVNNTKFRLLIHLHENADPDQSLKYWSRIANIPERQFWNHQIITTKSSQGKRPVKRLPYGTLHISIADTDMVRKLKGWILGLSQQLNIKEFLPR